MNKKKIHIHTDCPIFAGCERMLPVILNDPGLSQSFDLSLSYRYTKEYDNDLHQRLNKNQCALYPLRLLGAPLLHLPYGLWYLFILLKPILLIVNFFVLRRFFKRIGPHVLYINNGGYPGAFSAQSAVFAGKAAGIKSILFMVNNIAVPYSKIWRKPEKYFDKMLIKRVTRFITASQYAGTVLKKVLRLPEEKIQHCYNTSPLRDVTIPREQIRQGLGMPPHGVLIGTVGLLEKRKGCYVLVEAFKRIMSHQQPMPIKLVMIGFGPEEKNLRHCINNHAISRCCDILPYQDNAFNYYNAFDIFVLPSIAYDDLPLALREAMSMGLPIVSTRFAGIPEVVEHNRNGYLVPPGDSVGLADALILLIQHKNIRADFGAQSRVIYNERLSPGKVMEQYKALFSQYAQS